MFVEWSKQNFACWDKHSHHTCDRWMYNDYLHCKQRHCDTRRKLTVWLDLITLDTPDLVEWSANAKRMEGRHGAAPGK